MQFQQHQAASHPRKLLQDQVLTSPTSAVLHAINASLLISLPPPPTSQQALYSATPSSLDPNSSFSPSVSVILVALLSAFFFMGFFSILVRRCVDDPDRRAAARRTASSVEQQQYCNQNQQGLDPDFLHSLPLIAYSYTKKKGSNAECAVCLTDFEEHEPLRQLPKCKHVFHQDCIGMWLFSHCTCPVCRRNLDDVESRSASLRWGTSTASFRRLLESARASLSSSTVTENAYDTEMNQPASVLEHNQNSDVVRRDNSSLIPSTIVRGDVYLPDELLHEDDGNGSSESDISSRSRRQQMRLLKRCNSTGHSVGKRAALVISFPGIRRSGPMGSSASTSSNFGRSLNWVCLRRSSSTTALRSTNFV